MRTRIIGGERFGRLRVLAASAKPRYWICQCDCGVERSFFSSNLVGGKSKSCGCLQRELSSVRHKKHCGSPAMHRVIRYYKANAVSRGLLWNLDAADCERLFEAACSYCGALRSMGCASRAHRYEYNGIDRVHNAIGYTVLNSVSCCKHCNRMKGVLGRDAFLGHLARVLEYCDRTSKT